MLNKLSIKTFENKLKLEIIKVLESYLKNPKNTEIELKTKELFLDNSNNHNILNKDIRQALPLLETIGWNLWEINSDKSREKIIKETIIKLKRKSNLS